MISTLALFKIGHTIIKIVSCCKIVCMTLITKTSSGANYLYFQVGTKSMYIPPKNDPSKAKTDNVIKAPEYTLERIAHHNRVYDELLQFLPPKERKRYVRK